MDQLKPPEPSVWKGKFCRKLERLDSRFELYLIASGISEKSEKIKVCHFFCSSQETMQTRVHHIQTKPDVIPVIHPPRKVPIALKKDIERELKLMEEMGVIKKQTEPTEWVNSMVTIVKPNKIRICIDPQELNREIRREHYPLKTIEEVVAEMPRAKIFSVVDANQGFWQIRLDEESSKLCTFNTPFGRYSFTRLPFGISSAPEVFQRC
ncbi:hypothetical protein QQF64_024046 [Cirrhinus molitorella]|uniref:ribonuclease H n=1 Tax=Cirrhinus molitorella TaxID=172907 RepID=A0ABR3NL22_9TELE